MTRTELDARLDLGPALAATIVNFRRTQRAWADSTVQDAIESVNRVAWIRQVRVGVAVPVDALYRVPASRVAQLSAMQFVDRHVAVVAPTLRVPVAALRLAATLPLERTWEVRTQPPLRVHRTWTEREVPWRLRFEGTLRTYLQHRGTEPLEDVLEARLLEIISAWQGVSRARIASRGLARYVLPGPAMSTAPS